MNTFRICAAAAIISLLVGCNTNKGAEQQNYAGKVHVKQSVNYERNQSPKTSPQVSKHLVQLVSGIPGVNDATAIVLGRYAVVGIDVDKNFDKSRVGSIKYTVAEALKKDPYGANAVVTADPDTVQRLKNMGRDIQKGRPVSGITKELAEIIGRLMPQVPPDLMAPNPSPTRTNDKQLSGKDDKQLKKIQKENEKRK
ncbi:YhcN/YlaJ family sporulation lipoprotein [Fictibacillus sp. Mic-4]|uniref:YhcN/YlaJ family sporulation lipoprotein n=1 Tax=Fictibacillus TaxID=1329200 RepID=UPI00041B4F88|nr:YhcN/YlaJ family sporulation lipoprotein [Fictibacillus gelatini]